MRAFVFIYFRTLLKVVMAKSPISKRLLPEYKAPSRTSVLKRRVIYLDPTLPHVGIVAAAAIAALHIAFMGNPFGNLFFVASILLIIWQTGFGFFLRWRGAPVNLKRHFYSVHSQPGYRRYDRCICIVRTCLGSCLTVL